MPINIIPEGFKDDVSSQVSTEHHFKNLMIENFQLNGFNLVKTPLVEYIDKKNDKNVFKIVISKNKKKLIIRDDITLQVARLSQNRLSKIKRPLKLCYYGEVVRKEGSMLRPERQFLQIGAECIGESSYLADVEMIDLAFSSLSKVGIKDITIEISSRVFFDRFFFMIKNFNNKEEIKRLIKLKDFKSLLKIIDVKYHEYLNDLFNCTGIYKDKKNYLNKLGVDKKTSSEIHNIKKIVTTFSRMNNKVTFFLDLCEVDDKNYHSGIRFTFYAKNVRGEIARGGRYIVEKFKNKNEGDATGFTCYMDSILRASSMKIISKKILIPFDTNKIKINELIKKNFIVTKYFKNLDNIEKSASIQNFQFYLINNSIKKVS